MNRPESEGIDREVRDTIEGILVGVAISLVCWGAIALALLL